jgi:murein DD-endopeptidase MepM/ murein hydrolase activator NlpD
MRTAALLIAALLCAWPNAADADLRIDEQALRGDAARDGYAGIADAVALAFAVRWNRRIMFAVPAEGRLSSLFGSRADPMGGGEGFHEGIDIAAPEGTPVRAAAAGAVLAAGPMGGCGNAVVIDHGAGLSTRYCHLSATARRRGERVGAGEEIGCVGSTGRSTGPHLHFEVREGGVAMDPAGYLYQ